MALITVVEPNALLRLGIMQLLSTLAAGCHAEAMDYTQLLAAQPGAPSPDLMLLSVPDAYDRMVELVGAAQQALAPKRILLLSDTDTLPYSLLNLPPVLAGYVSKLASHDVLAASIMLVLAGGKCFPAPHTAAQGGQGAAGSALGDDAPRRRWYDRAPVLGHAAPTPCDSPGLLCKTVREPFRECREIAPPAPQAPGQPLAEPLSPQLVQREAGILNLTHRQYEVLALLARGLPLKRVSKELAISVATAKTHTEALYQRLGVNNRNKAVFAAVSKGATLGLYELHHDSGQGESA